MNIEFNPAKFYEWQAPSGTFTVQLSLDVARKLAQANAEYDREFSAVLLGYSMDEPERLSFIDDFVILPDSWDLQGGNYSSKFEETRAEIVRKLAEGAESGRHPIGFCRWQKSGLLELTGRDFASAQRFFAEADNVVLLIRYSAHQSEATFCYWEDGKIQVPGAMHYFSFDPTQLRGSGVAPLSSSETHEGWSYTQAPPPIPIEPEDLVPPRAWTNETSRPINWLRLIPTVAILTLVVAWLLNHGSQDVTAATAEPQAAAPVSSSPVTVQPVAAVLTSTQVPLGLEVLLRGKQLEIHWNHDAAVIRNAAKGVMRISDGGVKEVIEFDATQLRDGAVAYSPKTNDVSVRFEVNGLDGSSSSESVRSVAIP